MNYWKKYYEERASKFSEDYQINDWWSERSQTQICRDVNSLIPGDKPTGKFCLDVGYGSGAISRELVSENYVVGIDIADVMLRKNKTERVTAVVADAEKLPFRDNVFDTVLFVGIVYLLDNWEQALSESFRVLRRGGLFVFYSINFDSIIRKIHKLKPEYYKNMSVISIEEVEKELKALKGLDFQWLYDLYPLPIVNYSTKRSLIKELFYSSYALRCRKGG